MALRVVVSFRGAIVPDASAQTRYLERALATKKRAEAHGATLCAWSAQTFSFDFAADELEEALSLAALAMSADASGEAFMVGVSQGEISVVGEGGSFASLSWGPPLVAAVALARDAKSGEVLLDPALVSARGPELVKLGWAVRTDRTRELAGVGVWTLHRAPKEAAPQAAEPPPPVVTPFFQAPPEREASRSAASAPPPPPCAEPPVERRAPPLVRRAAPASQPDKPASDGDAGAEKPKPKPPPLPAAARRSKPQPEAPPDRAISTAATRALKEGDANALERLATELRDRGERDDAAERVSGLAALGRGATSEALRKLRAAAEAEQAPAGRARARLAYGIALAAAGRPEGATLEVLDALARAREAGDASGEQACTRFLAHLSTALGHEDAAAIWSRAGAPEAAPRDPAARESPAPG
jgi:hypothetical protein